MSYCEYAFDHEPNEECPHCKLQVDEYGNTEEDFKNCSFPNCGCDGARLCMAGEANENACKFNVEGMWNKGGEKNIKARMGLIRLIYEKKKNED